MATEQNLDTEITVDFILSDQRPGYGTMYENIGRTADVFRSLGTRGEKGPIQVIRFFTEQSEADAFLEALQTVRDGGYPAVLQNAAATEAYEIFLHEFTDARPQPVYGYPMGSAYAVRTTLTVTRLSTRRR